MFVCSTVQPKKPYVDKSNPTPQALSPPGWRTSQCSDTSTPISLTSGLSHRWWNLHFCFWVYVWYMCLLQSATWTKIFFRIQVRGATGAFGKRIELFSRFKAKCFFPSQRWIWNFQVWRRRYLLEPLLRRRNGNRSWMMGLTVNIVNIGWWVNCCQHCKDITCTAGWYLCKNHNRTIKPVQLELWSSSCASGRSFKKTRCWPWTLPWASLCYIFIANDLPCQMRTCFVVRHVHFQKKNLCANETDTVFIFMNTFVC